MGSKGGLVNLGLEFRPHGLLACDALIFLASEPNFRMNQSHMPDGGVLFSSECAYRGRWGPLIGKGCEPIPFFF
jgi:hypothetical protein